MLFTYLLLGLVQGVFEWLPVSSEGQLVLIAVLNGWGITDALTLAFWLHLGTMFAVLIVYRDNWLHILDPRKPDEEGMRKFLVITTIGTGVTGIPIKLFLEDLAGIKIASTIIMWIIGVSLLVTSGLIYFSRKSDTTNVDIDDIPAWQQFVIGCAQGFAIIPGISRSGTTVSALLFSNVSGERSFSASFMMAVPASLGSVLLDIAFAIANGTPLVGSLDGMGITLGIIMALIFGILTMKGLIELARRVNFAIITLIFGISIILFLLVF